VFNKGDWFRSFFRTGQYTGTWMIQFRYETQDGRTMYLLVHDTSGMTRLAEEAELVEKLQKGKEAQHG
jgi:hypothetical protein